MHDNIPFPDDGTQEGLTQTPVPIPFNTPNFRTTPRMRVKILTTFQIQISIGAFHI